MSRFIRFLFIAWVATLVGAMPASLHAGAPKVGIQVPGYYRMQLGQFEITALYDGAIELDTKLLKNTMPAELNRLLARMFVGNPKMQTAVNAYLINTGAHLVLVDAGTANFFGPTLGFILQNMKAAGYDPAQVDTVVITHLHPDHIGGLFNEGQPAFLKAAVFVAQADHDFWLSEKIAESSPSGMQPFFKMARDLAAPYIAAGQWKTFSTDGDTIVPGVKVTNANGHTPGHTAYEIESDGQRLLIWGDLVHAHAIQFARPGVAIEFDVDPKKAVATRLRIMKAVAAEKTLVGGMHLPFPGIGHVRRDGKNSYSWVPIEFGPLPGAATK